MTNLTKMFIVRSVIFAIIVFAVFLVTNWATTTVDPMVSTSVSLEQMRDTDTGHMAIRGFTVVSNDIRSFLPITFLMGLGFIMFVNPIKQLFKLKEEKEKDNK